MKDGYNLRADLIEVVKLPLHLVEIAKPVPVRLLWPFAKALSRSPGWMPSMFLIAMAGTVFVSAALFGVWLGGWATTLFSIFAWSTWALVSYLAMLAACRESTTILRRLGIRGSFRSRYWFEWGRLLWHVLFLVFVTSVSLSYIAEALGAKQVSDIIWDLGQTFIPYLGRAFVAVGVIGYLLAVIQRSMPRGRGFECVNYYLMIWISISLADIVERKWHAQNFWPDGLIFAGAGLLLVASLATLVIFGIQSWQKIENRAKR